MELKHSRGLQRISSPSSMVLSSISFTRRKNLENIQTVSHEQCRQPHAKGAMPHSKPPISQETKEKRLRILQKNKGISKWRLARNAFYILLQSVIRTLACLGVRHVMFPNTMISAGTRNCSPPENPWLQGTSVEQGALIKPPSHKDE